MKTPLLQVALTAGYGKRTLLRDVRFTLLPGERLGLLGGSGEGKSTLLLAILGLLKHRGGWARGEVFLAGENLLTLPERHARKLRGKEIALVPQSPSSALNPALPLSTQFEAAWAAHRRRDRDALSGRVRKLIDRVGLPQDPVFLKRKPDQISVGQAQRCALALALLHQPSVIIADEPTSALDPVNQNEIGELLREITEQEQAALLFVSHDLISVFRLCSALAVLESGHLSPPIPIADIERCQRPELEALLQALPLPVDVLLRHTARPCNAGTKVPDEGTLLTLSS